jgi:DNA-binding NarL/FixJ family response regulator
MTERVSPRWHFVIGQAPDGGDFLSVDSALTIMSTKNTRIRILIVDDHPLLREGVKAVLDNETDIEMQAEASNGREAVQAFRSHRPDVVLMDIQMPEMNGIDAIREIRSSVPDARIVVLTTYKGDVSALRALRAGAVGYLLKGELRTELVNTIRVVHAGGRRIPTEIATALAAHLGEEGLSEREIEVLRFDRRDRGRFAVPHSGGPAVALCGVLRRWRSLHNVVPQIGHDSGRRST